MPPPPAISSTGGSAPAPPRETGDAAPKARSPLRKLEFADALLFPYIAVFVRQCFWAVESDAAAWALTLAASALLWLAHLRAKPEVEGRTPRAFWLIVGLPLLLVFAARVAFPDLAFDVLNHRLIQAERSLRGAQLGAGDFFPTIFPFNPAPDMLTGVFRHLLGYRLGTIINLLALLWAGTVLEKILRPFVAGAAWRCLGVLLALFTEQALFQVNSYMVDLLALPLVLEATRLALQLDESRTETRDLLYAALLLGGATALKLTNAAMALPVLVVFAVRVFRPRRDAKARAAKTAGVVLLSAVFFLLPLLPHALYIYGETGNPFFPLYNNLVQSPLWPHMTPYDGRWGPRDLRETLLWPLLAVTEPGRLSELGVYSGRLTLGFLAALLCLLLPRAAARARLLALVVLLGSVLWSATSGYVRYAIFVEALGGVLLLYLAREAARRAARWPRPLRLAAAALPLCLLCAQAAIAARHVRETEWAKRPTVFDEAGAFRRELRWVWRDRALMDFQTAEARALFGQVDAWVVSGVKTNGVEVLLRPDVPMLAVNNLEYFDRPASRRRLAGALERLRGRRVYSLTLTEDLGPSLDLLRRRRLVPGASRRVIVPFFSARTRLDMTLVEVGLPEKRETPRKAPGQPEVTAATAPLDDDAFLAGISVADAPTVLRAGQRADIRVALKNRSEFVWPARGRADYAFLITVSNGWFDAGGSLVDNTDGKAGLPRDLWPGDEAEITLAVTAPADPGEYILEIDLVQEGIAWFKDKGSQAWRARVKVE
ncbi:MAG TPA: hypothetical protein VE360_07465 [Pyrinomonadaceae bacterium]|nr:hypothetical protein [Pyrinomonadaceae bacterium]